MTTSGPKPDEPVYQSKLRSCASTRAYLSVYYDSRPESIGAGRADAFQVGSPPGCEQELLSRQERDA